MRVTKTFDLEIDLHEVLSEMSIDEIVNLINEHSMEHRDGASLSIAVVSGVLTSMSGYWKDVENIAGFNKMREVIVCTYKELYGEE